MGKRIILSFGAPIGNDNMYGGLPFFSSAIKAATQMHGLFINQGFHEDSRLYLKTEATAENLVTELLSMIGLLEEEDLLVLSFCGHTLKVNQEYDLINSHSEPRGWVLYDRVMFHFEIWHLIAKIKPGVRVVLLADSCYSDDVSIVSPLYKRAKRKFSPKDYFEKHKFLYNGIMAYSGEPNQRDIGPSVVIISAGDENTRVADQGTELPTIFTQAFKDAWDICSSNQTDFNFHLSDLFDEICWQMFSQEARPFLNSPYDLLKKNKNKIIPKWHYYQGFKFTKLRTQTPIFNIKNN